MAATYEISQLRNGLRINVRKDMSLWGRILLSSFLAVIALIVTDSFVGNWSWGVALIFGIGAFATIRGSSAELRATNVEFVARGNFGRRGSRVARVVCTGDVRRLEFRDIAGQHSGLYALTARSAQCILPFLDYAETTEIIQVIEAKFPGLAETWQAELPPDDHFLKLGIGKTK
jgi:hypothetical protein